MARPQGKDTKELRNLITQWLGRQGDARFTVTEVVNCLYQTFTSDNLMKGVSNDLIRREKLGWLKSETGVPNGAGRPPRQYWKVWT